MARYTVDVARRVQRLFDGVRVDQPIWRNNMLGYDDPDLFQPRRESDPSRDATHRSAVALYKRAERQTILRMPRSKAVVFAIHSYVVRSKAHPLG